MNNLEFEISSQANVALWSLVACQLITGSTYIVAKIGLRELTPISFGCIRFLLAGVVLISILAFLGEMQLPRREDYGDFFLAALLGVPLNQGLFLYGIKDAPAAHGALLYATTPMVVMFLSFVFLSESITLLKCVGIALGFSGVLVILLEKGVSLSALTLRGDGFIGLAVIAWGFYTIINKRLLKKYRPLYVTALSLSIGSVLFLPLGIPHLLVEDYSHVSMAGVGSLFYQSFLTSIVAYLVWTWALGYLETGKVAVISNLQPVVATAMGWLVLGEIVPISFFVGAALVISGVFLTQKG
ncbi:MAG: DMT family transporter [Candidatus Riflebacteria bacterium]|nr:DMT family transporter [Candidatus Riflebacteria bacterium]